MVSLTLCFSSSIWFYNLLSKHMSAKTALPAEELKVLFWLLMCSHPSSLLAKMSLLPLPWQLCLAVGDPAHTELDYFLPIYLETIFTTFYQLSPTLNIPDITQFLSWSFRCSCFSYLVLLVSCFLPCFSAKLFSQWCSKDVHPLLIYFFF